MTSTRRSFVAFVVAFVLVFSAAAVGAAAPGDVGKSPSTRPSQGPTTRPAPAAHKIGLDEFDRLRAAKDHVVLDVRTAEEFAGGHVAGAVNVPVQSPDFDQKVTALDKDKTYLVHCARGGRSAQAVARMERMGFKNLADFSGGMEAWKKAGKPTTRADEK